MTEKLSTGEQIASDCATGKLTCTVAEAIDAALATAWLDDPRSKIMLAGWGAIQGPLKDHAVQGHIRGWNIQPIPEAVKAQEFWEKLQQRTAKTDNG
jgi:hypothetical protein